MNYREIRDEVIAIRSGKVAFWQPFQQNAYLVKLANELDAYAGEPDYGEIKSIVYKLLSSDADDFRETFQRDGEL